jgi:branched-subunit amino acid transport protein
MPPPVARALRFVPAAMLTAIVVPAVVFVAPATLVFSYTNPKLVGALVAALIAWRTKSATATMVAGMVALWIAKWLLPAFG